MKTVGPEIDNAMLQQRFHTGLVARHLSRLAGIPKPANCLELAGFVQANLLANATQTMMPSVMISMIQLTDSCNNNAAKPNPNKGCNSCN